MNEIGITLTEKEIKDIQSIQLEILIEFDRICRKHHISYSIDGGTLLGAIRHKGFIPWDPDIDIIMLRKDYDLFFEIAQNELDRERFFLQEYRTDKEYRWGFPKIRRNNTRFIRVGQEHLKMHIGIFIDLLIMDNVPNNMMIRELHRAFCWYCRSVLWSEVGKYEENSFLNHWLYKGLNHIPIKTIFKQMGYVQKLCNNRETELVRYMTCRYTYNKKLKGIPYKFFDAFAEYEFEGHVFPGFKEYDEYLTLLYGDYMTLPAVEKRKSHMPLTELVY